MLSSLRLEAIGDAYRQVYKSKNGKGRFRLGRHFVEGDLRKPIPAPWVAKIDIINGRMDRTFLRGKKDYFNANEIGSRGVYINYILEDGVYEVFSPISWRKTSRYFCRAKDGVITKISKEEAMDV